MCKNLHIDSVERNGVGIFRVLNWQAGAFVSKIIRMRIINCVYKMVGVAQKTKVNYHKKQK